MKRVWKSVGALLSAGVLMFGVSTQTSAENVATENLLQNVEISVNSLGEVVFENIVLQNFVEKLSDLENPSDLMETCCGNGCTCNGVC